MIWRVGIQVIKCVGGWVNCSCQSQSPFWGAGITLSHRLYIINTTSLTDIFCTLFHNSNTITSEWVGGCRQSPSTQRRYWGIKPNPARQCFWKDSIFFNPFMNALNHHFIEISFQCIFVFFVPSTNRLVSLLVCANVGG